MGSIEEDLQVDRFRNARHKLSVNLMFTTNWMVDQMQAVFKHFGVTNQQYNILRILRGSNAQPCTIQLLKERMMDKQPDVSRLVDRLQQKELVERTTNEKDRRKMDVVISERGLKLLDSMEDSVNAFEKMFDGLNEKQVEDLNNLLDRIRTGPIA